MVRLNNSLDSLAPLARETQGPPSWSFTRLGRLEACIRPPGAILGAAGSHDVRYGGGHGSRTRDPDVANVVLSQLS